MIQLRDKTTSSGARFTRDLVRSGNVEQLQTNVGDHPAPMLARHGDNTLLLHRASNNTIRLSLYDRNLAPVNAFGTNGTVTLAPLSRSEDERPPALCVRGDEVAVVWNQTGGDNLLFQRFRADTGAAIDASPTNLGSMTHTSPHPYVIHNGTHYAVVWVYLDGTDRKLQMRLIDNAGNLVGAQPSILITRAQDIRDPHLVWDTRQNRFLVVWVDSSAHPGGDIHCLVVDSSGNPVGSSGEVYTVAAVNTMRRPYIALHSETGYVILWEDNTQNDPAGNPRFDVYIKSLDNNGSIDFRIEDPLSPFHPIRISDTPADTSGFTCLVDANGILPVWQSNDEINSDLLGVYALNITNSGAFQAQADPNTPLINSGRYVRHRLHEQDENDLTAVSMVWAGGNYFLFRSVFDGVAAELHLMQANADGLISGDRQVDLNIGVEQLALHWANTRLIAAYSFGLEHRIFLLDSSNGNSINSFGTNGVREIREVASTTISPQLGHRGRGNNFRVLVAYGRREDLTHTIRYAVLNRQGNFVVAPRNLKQADGTARYGWFHYVNLEGRSIAAWHRQDPGTGNTNVFINGFRLNGSALHPADIQLTALPGDSQNAVIAPRPVLFDPPVPTPVAAARNSRRREYGVAWQYRPNAGASWEIRFSRLNRNGTVQPNPPAPAPPRRDVQAVSGVFDAIEPQLVWHTNGYGLAWLERIVEGAIRNLYFTILDQDGRRPDLRAFGAAAPAPAPNYQVSTPGADVKDFQLVWNGRTFRITWTEVQAGKLRHMQAAIAVPRQAGQVGYDQPYHHPTSALIRATLINGATNMRETALPNIGPDPNDGYGWGRINLRQSLAPLPPLTFHARDDSSVASGQTVLYNFSLPPNTQLLRITLTWTDPPGNRLVNNLNLRVTTPAGIVFVGNRWQPGNPAPPNPVPFRSDPLPAPPPPNPFEGIHNSEQVVLRGNPVPPGNYQVEVIGGPFRNNAFQQFPGQSFALVFVGSGPEIFFRGPMPAPAGIPVY